MKNEFVTFSMEELDAIMPALFKAWGHIDKEADGWYGVEEEAPSIEELRDIENGLSRAIFVLRGEMDGRFGHE